MTVFILKLIAAIAMTIDHAVKYFPVLPIQLRWIGRIAFPVFIFCLSEGVDHTSSRKAYLLRLYISSVIMAVIQIVLKINMNVFRTLFITACLLFLANEYRQTDDKKVAVKYITAFIVYQLFWLIIINYLYYKNQSIYMIRTLLPAIAGSFAFTEGGIPFVVLGLLIHLSKHNKTILSVSYIIYCIVYAVLSLTPLTAGLYDVIKSSVFGTDVNLKVFLQFFRSCANVFYPHYNFRNPVLYDYQWMMIAALPFMLAYNGRKGLSHRSIFYLYYPAHIIIFHVLSGFI